MPIKQEIAQSLTGHWQVGLFETPCAAPISFCYGCCCPCCMTAQQRCEILDVIGEPYICCGGLCPCGPLGEPQDRNCVLLEVCCCPGMALSANRFLIQTRFDRENTFCDDCILWTVCLASWAVCLLQCVGCDVPEEIQNCVDCMIMTVNGCMLAQQQVELDYIKKSGYHGPPQHIMGQMSPYQANLMSQGKPSVGMGVAAGIGGLVGGGAGAAAMGGAYGGGSGAYQVQAPRPQVMGHGGGFMSTVAPNGMSWSTYCGSSQPFIDGNGFIGGPWGECIAWSKVYEVQNPNWGSEPMYRDEGPTGQVIEALLSRCSGQQRNTMKQAADKLEDACEAAAKNHQPLPIIHQRAN